MCCLDGLIDFASSPLYSLTMGELLLDAAVDVYDSDSGSVPRRNDKTLQRCRSHLFKCIGYKSLPDHDPAAEVDPSFFEHETLGRLYWALGKLQLMEGRCQEAKKTLEEALEHAVKLDAPLKLDHVHNDAVLSRTAIESKLATCLCQNVIDKLPSEEEPMTDELYANMCTLLLPVLFPAKSHTKQKILTRDYHLQGLTFFKVPPIPESTSSAKMIVLVVGIK